MKYIKTLGFVTLTALLVWCGLVSGSKAQVSFEGDFRLRAYNDRFSNDLDNRGDENYMRYLGRLRAKIQADPKVNIFSELTTWTENNEVTPVRNIAATGRMNFGVSQLFAEFVQPRFLVFDVVRVRAGRQQFPIGNGLTQGESYYFFDKFDALRFDLAYKEYALSVFGAITAQNLSASGLYPDPGSDQLYITRLSRPLMGHQVMGYYIYNKLRGQFNDSYIFGGGFNGDKVKGRLNYFAEFAYQEFDQISGEPEKGGMGYMWGIAYRFPFSIFRSVKVETRYAAYQGDDADTDKIERFSPLYPSWFWGSRKGYVNGSIGGDYPVNGDNLEGTRVWFWRVYVIPHQIPRARLQFQYIFESEWVDNDNYNTLDDELSIKLYYQLSPQAQLQLRYCHNYPNDVDKDWNNSGTLTWSEDRVTQDRFMAEIAVEF